MPGRRPGQYPLGSLRAAWQSQRGWSREIHRSRPCWLYCRCQQRPRPSSTPERAMMSTFAPPHEPCRWSPEAAEPSDA